MEDARTNGPFGNSFGTEFLHFGYFYILTNLPHFRRFRRAKEEPAQIEEDSGNETK